MSSYHQAIKASPRNTPWIDLRSDTVTTPGPDMRQVMANAEVGDDVYDDDPTVNLLQDRLAEMLGKEAGLLMASGTMSNLSAMLSHCGRGDEIITAKQYHVFSDEAGGAAIVGGIMFETLETSADGALEPDAIRRAVKPDDIHCPVSRLLCLENTHHGKAIALDRMQAAADAGRAAGMQVHLDGARFFNAVKALNISPADLAGVADTVSICLSKGLGTPAGSVLVGPQEMINKAKRIRKFLGGGMRQVGVLAAAGLYALDHHIERLTDDHNRAAELATYLSAMDGLAIETATNMIFISSQSSQPIDAHHLAKVLADHGVLITPGDASTRLVMHLEVDDHAMETIKAAFQDWYESQSGN